ncbi:conserved hypothetical protein [Desulfovibrionales bacterium]
MRGSMKKYVKCKSCSLRGYSPEFCTLHHKFMQENDKSNDYMHSNNNYRDRLSWWENKIIRDRVGKTLAVGVCTGVFTSAVGLSAACLIGLKAMCETLLAAKVVAGAGMAGAVTSIVVNSRGGEEHAKLHKRRKYFVPPIYFNDIREQ